MAVLKRIQKWIEETNVNNLRQECVRVKVKINENNK